jgi:hypothetical protein
LTLSNLVAGRSYSYKITVNSVSSGTIGAYARDGVSPNAGTVIASDLGIVAGQTRNLRFVATSTNVTVFLQTSAAAADFDADVTVREVTSFTSMLPVTFSDLHTYERASTATYFDASGTLRTAAVDEPRYDYDPATGQALGLLIEESSTNNVLNMLAPSTQSVTVTAQPYTLSFYGTGSITLSGAATGSLSGTGVADLVSLTYTPSAGSLTLTISGDVRMVNNEPGLIPTSRIITTVSPVTRAADALTRTPAQFPFASMPSDLSWHVQGDMSYADDGVFGTAQTIRWLADTNNLIACDLDTGSTKTGVISFRQKQAGTLYPVNSADTYTPGINVQFSIASRHGSTFINGAVDGTVLTANLTPTALPDLSATTMQIAPTFNGHIAVESGWVTDIGDTRLGEITA